MILTVEELGAQAGKRAADLYRAREQDGTCQDIRRALPDAVRAARAEAETLRNGDQRERDLAIYWQNFHEQFEIWIAR
ncbi:hypothetical protein A1D31_35725 [Bradyrhizobium liaoningense]|nr:hypothetical protein A1D31_35725 [Bradyrhizobium liaoningense]